MRPRFALALVLIGCGRVTTPDAQPVDDTGQPDTHVAETTAIESGADSAPFDAAAFDCGQPPWAVSLCVSDCESDPPNKSLRVHATCCGGKICEGDCLDGGICSCGEIDGGCGHLLCCDQGSGLSCMDPCRCVTCGK